MDYYLLMDHFASFVRDFKDSEKEHDIDPRDSEQLALAIVDTIRYTRIRQWNLFQQKRGEEYEAMVRRIVERGIREEALTRFVEDEDRWKVTLEMGEH
jgi:hypothetical protein